MLQGACKFAGSRFGGVAAQTQFFWEFQIALCTWPSLSVPTYQPLAYILLCSLRQHHILPYLFRLWPGLHNRVDRTMIYTTLNRYENDCLPGWDVSLWRSYRITMQITPANMYANHSPIEYASLKIIRTCLYYQSAFPKVTHFTSIGKGGHIRSILTVSDDPFSERCLKSISNHWTWPCTFMSTRLRMIWVGCWMG